MFGNNIVPRSRSFGNGIKRSLDELAGFGVNGDEEIIHVTPGERVLPPSIAQDPQVMLATNAAFKASGMDPSMYVVGDPRSQRNPYTQLSMYATLLGNSGLGHDTGEPAPPPPVAPTPPTGMLRGDPNPLNPFNVPDSQLTRFNNIQAIYNQFLGRDIGQAGVDHFLNPSSGFKFIDQINEEVRGSPERADVLANNFNANFMATPEGQAIIAAGADDPNGTLIPDSFLRFGNSNLSREDAIDAMSQDQINNIFLRDSYYTGLPPAPPGAVSVGPRNPPPGQPPWIPPGHPDSIQALTWEPLDQDAIGELTDSFESPDPGNLFSDAADAVVGFFDDPVRTYDYPDSENREDFDLPHQDPVANADYHADSSLQQYDDYYHTYLNRHGEEAGIANWSNSGLDAAGIQAGFEGSQEYSNLNPNTTTTTTTGDNHGYEGNDLAVHGFYHTSFGPDRHVESAGLINWTDAINAGMTLEEAAANIHSSQEGINDRADVDSDRFDLDATITESIRQAFADLGLNIDGTPLNGDATTPTTSGNGGFVDDADLPFGVRYLRNLRTINADGSVSTGASPISYNAFRTSRRNALVGFGSGILDDRLQ